MNLKFLCCKTYGLYWLVAVYFLWGCTKEPSAPTSTSFTVDASYGTRYWIRVRVPESYDLVRPDSYLVLLYLDADWLETQ